VRRCFPAKDAFFFLILVAGVVSARAKAETLRTPVQWAVSANPTQQFKPGDRITVSVRATIAEGWHLYSISQAPGGPVRTTITVPPNQGFHIGGTIVGPPYKKSFDENFNMETEFYVVSATFRVPVAVAANAKGGKAKVPVNVYFQACNDRNCTIPTVKKFSVGVEIVSDRTQQPPSLQVPHIQTPSPVADAKGFPVTMADNVRSPSDRFLRSSHNGGLSFLWLAAVMGGLSLLTPCVFPMIPITVSYFTNHPGGNRRNAILSAFTYALGIILTFTALGILLAILFGAGGVNQLAANPWVNLLIAAIFLGFAFSLFGVYFIQAPAALMNRIDSVSRSHEGSQIVGALLMGFTFTLTSFTCTAPFVGTLLVVTTLGNWRWPLAGMLVFATVFAIPFFILALAPQLLAQLPKAGDWMNSVKVVMGFLEIAAAMKFLSNADLVWHWGVFTRQLVLAVWVGVGLLMVIYVLGYIRLGHCAAAEAVGAARLTVALVFLTATIWLVPGLFGRQLGELESFLPPELNRDVSSLGLGVRPDTGWIMNDYDGALVIAKQENKFIFIDFTGYTCTNCRWMEANMFPRPEISQEMSKFIRARLYTDGAGEVFDRHRRFLQDKFGTVALPFYAIVAVDGSVVATFPGLTRNPIEFLSFLRKASV